MLKNQIRIISGKWRGKKLTFPHIEGLRPTLDRVRETLFNWLNPIIDNSRCLDVFAGSGALGFEALSRGAKEVVFVDQNDQVIKQLDQNAQLLNLSNTKIIRQKADQYLKIEKNPFDIIFLDPPFYQNLLNQAIQEIHDRQLIKPNGHIYIEMPKHESLPILPAHWKILKDKKAGNVCYYLIQNEVKQLVKTR